MKLGQQLSIENVLYPHMTLDRRRFLSITVAGSIGLAGCGGNGDDGGDGDGESPTETESTDDTTTSSMDGTTTPSAGTTVKMANTSFDPVRASVDVGTTVEWVNEDGFDHDVTAEQFHDAAVDWTFSETLSGGETTTFTFDSTGVYEYYCTIHGKGNMCGAVLVGDVSLDQSLPCEDDGGGGNGGGGY